MKRRHPDCYCSKKPECRYCNGTGRICDPSPPRSWECTSCNVTGIEGDPRYAVLFMLLSALVFAGFVVWLLR